MKTEWATGPLENERLTERSFVSHIMYFKLNEMLSWRAIKV